MNPKITLTLDTPNGPFIFTGAEVPQKITIGGKQLLDKQQMIGGRRRFSAIGADDAPLAWSGWFLYSSALTRARFLDSVRRDGLVCTLTWDVLRYQVVISEFHADYEQAYKVPYQIVCEVIDDQTSTLDNVPGITPAQALATDMSRASTIFGCINNPTLSALGASVQSAISSVTAAAQPIANGLRAIVTEVQAIETQVQSALQCAEQIVNGIETAALSAVAPVLAMAAHVQQLISSAEGVISSGGGVLPGIPAPTAVFNTLAKLNAAVQLPELYELRSIAARMQVNLPLVATPTSAKTITVGGGNLYQVAADQYGDASRWTDIAAANNLTDPVLTGINTLKIPA